MADDGTLGESDWEVLVAVPFAVFLLVAYADGRLAPAERRAFMGIVDGIGTRARGTDDALVREVMGRISRDSGQVMERLDAQVGSGLPFYEVFAAATSVLDRMPQREIARAFKEAMIHLAEEVARAWPILGRRTSVEEARSIGFIRDQLGLRDHAQSRYNKKGRAGDFFAREQPGHQAPGDQRVPGLVLKHSARHHAAGR